MPDIWTKYPEIVRRILEEAGLRCGVEPQILARNVSETCQLVKENFLGEIYIHDIALIPKDTNTALIFALAIAVFIIMILLVLLARCKKLSKKRKVNE